MGDGGGRGGRAEDESWTDMEDLQPDLVEAVPVRHGMVLAGRYAIEKIIGRGGSGVVVRAHDRDLNQEVAIKIVRAELAGQRMWAARLAREVRLARQIQHPHVCRVFDFQQADGRVFLVMELAEAGRCATRSDRARRRRGRWRSGSRTRARWRRRWRRFTRAGIVHRDLIAAEPAAHGRRAAGAVGLRPGDRRQREHQRPRRHDRVHGARGDARRTAPASPPTSGRWAS